jgi:CRP-like cAMP-binding protein
MPFAVAITRCPSCPIGVAAARDGCPFVREKHRPKRRLRLRGAPTEKVTFIKRGYAVLSSGTGQRHLLRGPGTLVGWETLTEGPGPATHTLTTLTDCETCMLDPDAFRAFVATRAAQVLPLLVAELESRDGEARYASGPARVRVARFLLARLRRGGAAYPVELQNKSLARVLALRPETLSRVLTQLRARGILTLGAGLFVKDVVGLAEIAGGGV